MHCLVKSKQPRRNLTIVFITMTSCSESDLCCCNLNSLVASSSSASSSLAGASSLPHLHLYPSPYICLTFSLLLPFVPVVREARDDFD